jgi:rubrerythrin
MDKKTQELFEMFKVGVEKERQAQEFYKELIEKSSSDAQKQVFQTFLKQEEGHEKQLMNMYAELKERSGLK